MFKIGLMSAALAATLFSTSVEAARCPPGQIYRVSKKFCQDKATAIKQGVFKPRKSRKALGNRPIQLTPATKKVRRKKARRLKQPNKLVTRPTLPAATGIKRETATPNPANPPANPLDAAKQTKTKPAARTISRKIPPEQIQPERLQREKTPAPATLTAPAAPAARRAAAPAGKPVHTRSISPLQFARPENPAAKLKPARPTATAPALKSISRTSSPKPRLVNPKPAPKPAQRALKSRLQKHVEKNRAKYTNRVEPK